MYEQITGPEILLSLHRKLYSFEGEKGELTKDCRLELCQLLKNPWNEMGPLERDYIFQHISEDDLGLARKILLECGACKTSVVTWFDEGYPILSIEDPPPIFFLKGSMPDPVKNPYVAIVGSRKATNYGRNMTTKIVEGLAPYGATIVSGLAYGIDATAHRAAIDVGLPTVAVLGCGINYCYPASHRDLLKDVARVGAVISEFPWGTPPFKYNFPLRNRVISGLSRGVVVVEAEIKSGSLITSRWAADQGREVFAVPGDVGRALSSGTNLLIKEGAHLIENGDDIAGVLRLEKHVTTSGLKKNSGQEVEDDDIKRAILEFLENGGNNLEDLVEKTGLSVEKLLPVITGIEIKR